MATDGAHAFAVKTRCAAVTPGASLVEPSHARSDREVVLLNLFGLQGVKRKPSPAAGAERPDDEHELDRQPEPESGLGRLRDP